MKKYFIAVFLFTLFCFSCRVIIDAESIITVINTGGGSGTGGSTTGGGSGTGGSGTGSGGNSTPYTPPQSGTQVTGGGQSLERVEGKFVRPASGGGISLTPTSDSDIWYLFTNGTDSSVNKPNYSIPSGYNNILAPLWDANILKNFSNPSEGEILPLAGWQVDYQDKPVVIELAIDGFDNYDRLERKGTRQPNDASGEKKGDVRGFNDGSRHLEATCRLKREVNTKFGKRILLIYTENNTKAEMPNDSEIAIIADAFLKDGLDNDIYDKVTGMFGCDWGYYNYDYLNNLYKQSNDGNDFPDDIPPIHNDGTITLLYCNVENQGSLADISGKPYTGGYFSSSNASRISEYNKYSNERAMVLLYGPVSCGAYLGQGLTTLAHEFQHLIHDQYYDPNLDQEYYQYYFGTNVKREANSSLNECFSSLAESYVADFISQQSGQTVPGPFMVGSGGPNDRRGYLESSDRNACINGRGPYYLSSMDNVSLSAWNGELTSYGIVASFAHYLLVNYGKDVVSAYMTRGVPNLDGIVDAINYCNSSANMTRTKLIADWGTAVMLSSRTDMTSPYSINRHGWYIVNGLAVPSVNIWLYRSKSGNIGVSSSSNSQLIKDTNTAYKVGSVGAGRTFTATAPQLADGVILTVVAVPR